VQKDANGPGLARIRTGLDIDMTSGTADEAADRALSGVARKLDKGMSVEYTVNELIADATDQMKLATIWHGECFGVGTVISNLIFRLGRHLLVLFSHSRTHYHWGIPHRINTLTVSTPMYYQVFNQSN
jgi:hypothetical protein